MKGTAYEGGIRVPLIVRWPGAAKPGAVCHTPVHAVDLLPTCFALAGTRAPSGYVTDGLSITPLLREERIPDRALYWYMPF
jgi:arylsulfatase A